jgi:hypothetical protein
MENLMAINFSKLGGGSSSGGGGDFVINTGDYSSDTAELSIEFAAGAYGITASPTDSTLDIYLVASDGSFAGYTNTDSITATIPFNKVVVLGSTASTILSFIFNGESQTVTTKGQLGGAGAVISSVVTSSLPSVDDTTVVNGGNFAADVEVTFIDQSSVETAAKAVVRSSSTQLIVTRPDTFSTADSPFTVKVVNPGIPVPSASSPHLLSNSVTAGTNPVWITGSNLYIPTAGSVSVTLLATDTEASDIDYSILSGTLPAGLTLDGETGTITGTASYSEGASTAVAFRAIDAGGNFLDKTITVIANDAPVWTTSAGALTAAEANATYSNQLVASGGAAGGTISFALESGSLPAGVGLSSSGLISGTSSESIGTNSSFVVRATDAGEAFTDRSFTLLTKTPVAQATGGSVQDSGGYRWHVFNGSGTLSVTKSGDIDCYIIAGGGSGGANAGGGGGGGAGGVLIQTAPTVSVGDYAMTVGNGGADTDFNGNNGQNSTAFSLTAIGGGGGGSSGGGFSGGSGGGGRGFNSYAGGPATTGQGNEGGNGGPTDSSIGGGGGGYSSVGKSGAGNNSTSGDGGTGIVILGQQYAGGGGGGANQGGFNPGEGSFGGGSGGTRDSNNATAATKRGSGGGGGGTVGKSGFNGVIIVRYPLS